MNNGISKLPVTIELLLWSTYSRIERVAKRASGAPERRHHGAGGKVEHLGQFLIRQALELTQHHDFPGA
jgi:hypothetical protein